MRRAPSWREPGPLLAALLALLIAAGGLVGGLSGAGSSGTGLARALTRLGTLGPGSADGVWSGRSGYEPQRTVRPNGPRWATGRDAPDGLAGPGGSGPAAVVPAVPLLVLAVLLVLIAAAPARFAALRPAPSRGRGPPAGRVTPT